MRPTFPPVFGALGALAVLAAPGCSNEISGGGGGDQDPIACELDIPQAGEARIRRLSPRQYQNTVRDLFGDPSISVELPPSDDAFPSALEVETYDQVATRLAPRGVGLVDDVDGCDREDAACADAFIDAFGTRAFRRPLAADERAWLRATFDAARGMFDFDGAITVVTQVVLTSPQFLYLAPVGTEVPDSPHGVRRLDDYELAARLSYFLWNSTPDDELLAAAADDVLTSGDGQGLREQAERMLADDRARAMADDFVSDWFQLDGGTLHFSVEAAPKDGDLYPEIDADLRAAMRREIGALVERVVFEGGEIADLFTSTDAYVNGPLAALYGVVGGPTREDDWRWVSLDPSERAGLLTRAAFATVYSSAKVPAAIRRGTFVLRRVLCYDAPPPPPDVDNRPIEDLEADEGEKTLRELTEIRTGSAACTGCHTPINEIGYTFEHYDAIGAYRTAEVGTGLPIDASGVLHQAGDADGPVADAIGLSQKIAGTEVAASCLERRWFEHALRRDPDLLDECSFESIREATGGSHRLDELVYALIASDAFTHVNPGAE